jgi:CelD/BcsL family acetyltransferase involved in cellulose biosynthesis
VVTHLDDDQPLPLRGGTGVVRGQAHRLPWATLDGGWSAYLTRRSRNFRADLKRKERTLTDGHEIAYRRTLTAAELDSDLDTFFLLHDDRWTDRGGSSSSSNRARAFLRELASASLASGALRLWQLTADGRPIAALYAWSLGDTYSYYLAGFDRDYSRHSPGTLLLAHTLKEAADEGKSRYDFLLGDEDYKVRFADHVATVSTLVLSDRRIAPAYLLARTEASARAALRRLPSGPRSTLQRGAARLGARLPLTRTR